MIFRRLVLIAAAGAHLAMSLTAPATASDGPRISGPAVHENLAIYFIHGPSAPGPVPLTLREAITAGTVTVHETGSVSRLSIENSGDREVFVQAGDIVKGGQQDRVLTISLMVPPRSGRLDIGAYCVEQGRWSQRGKEDVKRFASAEKAIPSKAAKLAMLMPTQPREAPRQPGAADPAITNLNTRAPSYITLEQRIGASDTGSRQSQVWSSVAAAQRKLTANLGAPVTAAASASSLQLSLENDKLNAARAAFIAALEPAARDNDIVGFVFTVGGKLNSGDMYGSNGLFRKMWSKQLEAAVTEAITEQNAPAGQPPAPAAVAAFIASASNGTAVATTLPTAIATRETRTSDIAIQAEMRRSTGGLVHRALVAK